MKETRHPQRNFFRVCVTTLLSILSPNIYAQNSPTAAAYAHESESEYNDPPKVRIGKSIHHGDAANTIYNAPKVYKTPAYVTTATYVYETPDKATNNTLGKLFSYAPIGIDKHINDKWTRIIVDNTQDTGYILRNNITLRAPSVEPNYKNRTLYISGAGVKVRRYSSTEQSPVQCMSLMGQNVSSSYVPTDPYAWAQVEHACPLQWHKDGYVQRRFLSEDAPNIPKLFQQVDDTRLDKSERIHYAERALEAAYTHRSSDDTSYILPALNRLYDLIKNTDNSKAHNIRDTLFRINILQDERAQEESEQFFKENPIKMVVKNMPTKQKGYGYAWADVQKKIGLPDSIQAISRSDDCDFSAKHYVANYPFAQFYLNADKTEARIASMDMVAGNYVMINNKRFDTRTVENLFLKDLQGLVAGSLKEQAFDSFREYRVFDKEWATNFFTFEKGHLIGLHREICMG